MRALGASSVRDRTTEFQSIVERLKKQNTPGAAPQDNEPSTSRHHQHTEFSQRAAQIGYGIAQVSTKLQQLTKLAKRTSVFDDTTQQINELTGIIKQDIQALNKGLASLQTISNSQYSENRQTTSHTHTVVDNLRSRLKDTTTEFKGVLEARKDNLKVHNERRKMFSSGPPDAAPVGGGLRYRGPGGPLTAAAPMFGAQPAEGSANGDSGAPSMGAAPGGAAMAQQLVLQEDNYMSSRAEAMQNVESTILELGNIFSQLSALVQEQGELAIRIDENIDDTLANVDRAQGQLLKYLNTISSNRWLIMKVFGVLMAFFIFFIMFIA